MMHGLPCMICEPSQFLGRFFLHLPNNVSENPMAFNFAQNLPATPPARTAPAPSPEASAAPVADNTQTASAAPETPAGQPNETLTRIDAHTQPRGDAAPQDARAAAPEAPTEEARPGSPNASTASRVGAPPEHTEDEIDAEIAKLPARVQDRAREIVAKARAKTDEVQRAANEALERVAAYEAQEEARKAPGGALSDATGQADAARILAEPVDEATVKAMPAVVAAQTAADNAKTAFAAWEEQNKQTRERIRLSLIQKVREGEITMDEGDAEINRLDAAFLPIYQAEELKVQRLEFDANKAVIDETSRLTNIRTTLRPVIEANPNVPAAIIEHYAAQGHDIEPIAAWHTRVLTPFIDKVKAQVLADAQTESAKAIAAKDAEITRLKAENKRISGINDNIAAAPSTIAVSGGRAGAGGSGNTAPPRGTDRGNGRRQGFGFVQAIRSRQT
jgi:hypothetical protein